MKNIIRIFCITSLFITSVVYADIKFWTTEVQPARMAKQEEMAKAFEAKTGIKVDVIPIEEKELGTRATAAAAVALVPRSFSSIGITSTLIPVLASKALAISSCLAIRAGWTSVVQNLISA